MKKRISILRHYYDKSELVFSLREVKLGAEEGQQNFR